MSRARNCVASRRRRKKVLKAAKGFKTARSKQFRTASIAMLKANSYSYRDRKVRQRDFRRLWIVRINAAARLNDMSYSQLIAGLQKAGSDLNRKVLADMAVNDPTAFADVVGMAKAALAQ